VNTPARAHRTIRITGLVQGVFYRTSARAVAEGLGVCGHAHNNLDGSVTIEAEGTALALDEFTRWCEIGPARAEVLTLDAETGAMQYYTSFTVS